MITTDTPYYRRLWFFQNKAINCHINDLSDYMEVGRLDSPVISAKTSNNFK